MSSQRSAVAGTISRSPPGGSSAAPHDGRATIGVTQPAQPLDLERHLVARLQVAPQRRLADLEQAAAADRAAAEDLARPQPHVGGRPGHHVPERVVGARPRPARRLDRATVVRSDRPDHRQVRPRRARGPPVRQLIGRDQPRPDRHREVLALRGPEPERALVALQVPRRPVVEDDVAADRLLATLGREVRRRRVDQRADLQLVVQLEGAARRPHGLARPAQPRHVGEVEDREPIPRLRDHLPAPLPHGPDVPLEGVEVTERRRAEDRGAEGEVVGVEDRVVPGGVTRDEPLDQVDERGHAKAAGEMVVEGRDRLAVERAVVGQVRVRADGAPPGDLEVHPARAAGIERRRQAPVGSCGGVSFSDVGETHRPSLAKGCGGPGSPRTGVPRPEPWWFGSSPLIRDCRARRRDGYLIILPSASTTYHFPPRPWPLVWPAAVSPAK